MQTPPELPQTNDLGALVMGDNSELAVLIDWLVNYPEKPVSLPIVRRAQGKNLSAKSLLTIGHSTALMAVCQKIREILRAMMPEESLDDDDRR